MVVVSVFSISTACMRQGQHTSPGRMYFRWTGMAMGRSPPERQGVLGEGLVEGPLEARAGVREPRQDRLSAGVEGAIGDEGLADLVSRHRGDGATVLDGHGSALDGVSPAVHGDPPVVLHLQRRRGPLFRRRGAQRPR
jgi:hypothetical protein